MPRKKEFLYSLAAGLTIFSVFLSGCSKKIVEPISNTELLLDTPCKITVYDKVSKDVLNKGFEKLREVDRKMNASSPDSEISQISGTAGESFIKVSDDTFYVIKKGIEYGDMMQGKFDISVGPLVKMWGINTDHERVPSEKEIKAALPLVSYKNVFLNDKTKEVMLRYKGMSLDLGGIAKGYSADLAAEALKANGVRHALINLGGNVLAIGSKPDGSNWNVGIQDPNSDRGDYFGIISVSDKAVVTSGIYERYFIKDNKRYHHILDTSTGYPVDNELSSVTIVTGKSIDADALAKSFCMGLEKGMEFIKSQKEVEGIFVTKDNRVYVTSGLKNSFRITDETFKLVN